MNSIITYLNSRYQLHTPITDTLRTRLHKSLLTCPDCNDPATILISEISNDVTKPDQAWPLWGWCGQCDIGG